MRPLFLHSGLPKTGTTYLQKVMAENRDLLAAAGLGFGPYLDPRTGSHYPKFVEAVEAKGAEAVIAQTAACPEARLLVSDENLASLMKGASPTGPGRLYAHDIRDAAAGRFTVKVIIYVRRQDYLMESVFAQSVKDWYHGDILADRHYDYDHNRIALLEAVFGLANVKVRIYDDPATGDILAPFLDALELELDPRQFRPIPPQNVSTHRRKVLFLSQVPKPAAAREDQRHRVAPRLISRVVARSAAIADDGGRFILSPRQRHDLVAAHQPGNRALVARHGIADPGGFLDLPDPDARWQPPAPITRREIAAVHREVLAACWKNYNPFTAAALAARTSRLLAAMALRTDAARPVAVPAAEAAR